jgi:hypothetical protein
MELKRTNRQVINEVPWGVYVWQIEENGEKKILADDGNFMLVRCNGENHWECKQAIAAAAKHYGYPEGKAIFWSGVRPINDEEYEEQLERARQGLVPDPFDIGAIKDEMKALRQNGG